MEYRDLSEETVDAYLAYLERAAAEDPEMMFVQTVDPDGIRARVADPFYRHSTSILAVEEGRVLGRLEYHFYGCIQDGFRMAYVDWVYVRKAYGTEASPRAFSGNWKGGAGTITLTNISSSPPKTQMPTVFTVPFPMCSGNRPRS